jgi:5-hydroxyisourate hydrolase
MSAITTHVLDTSKGRPGSGINVVLEFKDKDKWDEVGSGQTNFDGRLPDLVKDGFHLTEGIYRLTFDTHSYYESQKEAGFYPQVSIVFEVKDPTQHYHVPLLLSPFGYQTYRGS